MDKIGDKNVCKLFDVSLVYMEEFKIRQNAYKLKFKKSGNMWVYIDARIKNNQYIKELRICGVWMKPVSPEPAENLDQIV